MHLNLNKVNPSNYDGDAYTCHVWFPVCASALTRRLHLNIRLIVCSINLTATCTKQKSSRVSASLQQLTKNMPTAWTVISACGHVSREIS